MNSATLKYFSLGVAHLHTKNLIHCLRKSNNQLNTVPGGSNQKGGNSTYLHQVVQECCCLKEGDWLHRLRPSLGPAGNQPGHLDVGVWFDDQAAEGCAPCSSRLGGLQLPLPQLHGCLVGVLAVEDPVGLGGCKERDTGRQGRTDSKHRAGVTQTVRVSVGKESYPAFPKE